MTTKELNRDIKRLGNKVSKCNLKGDDFFDFIENEVKLEFKRLYWADTKCEYMNFASLRVMMILNRKHRFIAFHTFFIYAEL